MSDAENLENSGRPATDSERRLAGLWADVLGVPIERIGRDDNFFEIGGTSRAAARLVIALERRLTIGEFARAASLAHLADLLDRRTPAAAAARRASALGG